jgi:hypothetical protein
MIVLKVMLSVWLIFEGVLHFKMIPKDDLYCQQLDMVYAATPEKNPAMIEGMRVHLQRDNVPSNRAVQTQLKQGRSNDFLLGWARF